MVDFVECFRHVKCTNVRSTAFLNNFINDAALYSTNGKVAPNPFLEAKLIISRFQKRTKSI